MRRPVGVLAAAALVGGLLAGCSSDGDGPDAAPSASAGDPSTSPTSPTSAGPDDPAYDAAVSTPREDSVYPAHGDPGIDVLHYGLDLAYDPPARRLTGTADIALRATRTAARFQLDLRADYEVSSVTVDGAAASYQQTDDDLLVVTTPVTADERYAVVVDYAGKPRRAWSPSTRTDTPFLGLQRSPDQMLWTMQEPYGAFTWYPVNDQPADKALYDFTLRTPADWVGVANGELTSKETEGDQTVTTWHLDRPAASYLTTMAMGAYTETKDESASGVPLSYWTKTTDTTSLERLKVLPEVMAWAEKRLGPYPFDTLGLVVVDSESAMETQTMITLGDTDYTLSPAVILHELVHQWYGDLVTPADWRDVWLNEGMTMYLQLAYEAEQDGTTLDRKLNGLRSYEAVQRLEGGPPGRYKRGQFGLGNIYYGPALMFNEIRHRVGDEKFWALVKAWPQVHAYGSATRAQYVAWLEQQTGLQLKAFVTAWLMDKETPKDLRIP